MLGNPQSVKELIFLYFVKVVKSRLGALAQQLHIRV